MTISNKQLCTDELWQFSLSFYASDNVQKTLLTYQNSLDENVNFLLLLFFLDTKQLYFNDTQLLILKSSLQDFNQQFTTPLRAIRQSLKSKQELVNNYETIRKKLLDVELNFEKQEQTMLLESVNLLLNDQEGSDLETSNVCRYEQILFAQHSSDKHLTPSLTDLNQYIV